MSKKTMVENLPEAIPEDFELELHKSCWAVRIDEDLYVFPPETTKQQAEDILRQAIENHKTRFN